MQSYIVSCPKCHSRLKVKGQPAASIRIRCPKCDEAVTVRTAAAEEEYTVTAEPMIDEGMSQPSVDAFERHASRPIRRGSVRRQADGDGAGFPWQLAAWIGGGAVVVLCTVFVVIYVNTMHSKPEIRERPDRFGPGGYGMNLPAANELAQEPKPQAPVPPPTASQPTTTNPSPSSGDPSANSATPSAPSTPTPPKAAAPAAQVPVWSPDAKLLEYLGDPQPIPGTEFRVRLPKGYDIHAGGAPGLRTAMAPNPQTLTSPKPMHFDVTVITGMLSRGVKSDEEEFAETLKYDQKEPYGLEPNQSGTWAGQRDRLRPCGLDRYRKHRPHIGVRGRVPRSFWRSRHPNLRHYGTATRGSSVSSARR